MRATAPLKAGRVRTGTDAPRFPAAAHPHPLPACQAKQPSPPFRCIPSGVSELLLASLELGDATGIRLDEFLTVFDALGIGLAARGENIGCERIGGDSSTSTESHVDMHTATTLPTRTRRPSIAKAPRAVLEHPRYSPIGYSPCLPGSSCRNLAIPMKAISLTTIIGGYVAETLMQNESGGGHYLSL